LVAAEPVPKLISANPEPEYSDLGLSAGVEGEVQLQVLIGAEGGPPRSVEVTGQLGWGLDEQAVKAVSQWKFRAANLNGKPIDSTAKIECHFAGARHGDLKFGAMAFDLPIGVSKPVMTSFIAPDFVREFGARSEMGKVAFTVNEQGEPENFRIERPSSPGLEKAVLQALRQWRFQPALKNGEAVPVRGLLTFESAGQR